MRLSQPHLLMCKCWCFRSTPKLPTITMKIAAVEFWCFNFCLPRSAWCLWGVGSPGTRNNIDPRVSEANLPFIEDDPASVDCDFFSLISQLHKCCSLSNTPVLFCSYWGDSFWLNIKRCTHFTIHLSHVSLVQQIYLAVSPFGSCVHAGTWHSVWLWDAVRWSILNKVPLFDFPFHYFS